MVLLGSASNTEPPIDRQETRLSPHHASVPRRIAVRPCIELLVAGMISVPGDCHRRIVQDCRGLECILSIYTLACNEVPRSYHLAGAEHCRGQD